MILESLKSLLPFLSEWLGVIAVTMILGTIERLKPKPVGYRYPRREAVIALSLFAILFLGNIWVFSGRLALPAVDIPDGSEGMLWPRLAVALGSGAIVLLALLVRRQPMRSAGWSKRVNAGFRWGLVLVFLTIFLRGAVFKLTNGVTREEITALLVWLGIALAEETVFRGYIQSRLDWFAGERWGWLITVVLYVLWNLPRLLPTPEAIFPGLVAAGVQGLLLGWIMKKSGHVLAPALYRSVSEWILYLV